MGIFSAELPYAKGFFGPVSMWKSWLDISRDSVVWLDFPWEEKFLQIGCQLCRNLGHMHSMCEKQLCTFTVSLTHLGNDRLAEQMICASRLSWLDWTQREDIGSKCPAAAKHWTHCISCEWTHIASCDSKWHLWIRRNLETSCIHPSWDISDQDPDLDQTWLNPALPGFPSNLAYFFLCDVRNMSCIFYQHSKSP